MTTRIAFIDLDGVVADNTTRFAKAEEAKRNAHKLVLTTSEATNLYWQTAFTPELVALDTLIPGVNDTLLTLDELDYRVIFLTCRKMPMYWLRRQLIEYGGYRSINGVLVSLKVS